MRAMPNQLTAGTNYDLKYHRLSWVVDPNVRYIAGEVTSYLVPVEPNVSTISFDLSNALTVDSVHYHGAPAMFQQTASELQITFAQPLTQGQLDSVSVWYQGVPPQTGLGSFMRANHSSGPIIWTLSDPWGGKDWWPGKMTIDDKIDSTDIYITTPQAYKAGSNGKLISVQTSGANHIYYWKHRYPITSYLIAIAVSNYEELTLTAQLSQGPLDIVNYIYPQTFAVAQTQIPATVPIMQLYDTLFTPYPFMGEKYGHAQFGWGGGMEHQTMSFMANFSRDLIAHELAHQWFGNKVTFGRWHDIWLSEGWATYLTGLAYENMNTPQQWLQWKSGQIGIITGSPGGSVFVDDTTDINRIFNSRLTYTKGSMVLHMLRWVVGDSAFFAATRNYLNDPALAYNYAVTANFKQHMEAASGKDLTEFFADWYYGQGYPRYQAEWGYNATSGAVEITLNQTQSHPSVSFFEMPVPVQFSDGTTDTVLVFNHTSSGQTFTAPINFVPASATIDPERWIVQRNSTIVSGNETDLPEAKIKVYPNPAHDKVKIAVNMPLRQPVKVGLMDALGRRILAQTIPETNAENYELDIASLQPGIYHLQLTGTNWVVTKKVIKN